MVGDIDVDIEYDAKLGASVERELIDNLVTGRDWNTPFRKALKPARALQVMFNNLEMLAEPTLVYERGDSLADSLARVEAINPDPAAGRAERDPVHPALEPVADDLVRPSHILLAELAAAELLAIEVVDLSDAVDADIADVAYRDRVGQRWSNPASPLARAARAAGRHLEARGVDLRGVVLMATGAADNTDTQWAIDCRETHLPRLVTDLGYHRIANGLFVLHPERKRPLRAIQLAVADPSALPSSDLEGWLSKRAPHIHRIG